MNELYFIGMNIHAETKASIEAVTADVCKDMNENERRAYSIGVYNTLNMLSSILESDGDNIVVHLDSLNMPEEFSEDDLRSMLYEDYC